MVYGERIIGTSDRITIQNISYSGISIPDNETFKKTLVVTIQMTPTVATEITLDINSTSPSLLNLTTMISSNTTNSFSAENITCDNAMSVKIPLIQN